MSAEQIFSRRMIIGIVAGAVAISSASLYFLIGGETGPESSGANAFSPSAIGHAGFAEVLRQIGTQVVKSRHASLEKLSPGSVLIVAEPLRGGQAQEEQIRRALLAAPAALLVLPKWTGAPDQRRRGWLKQAAERPASDARWVLELAAPRAELVRESAAPHWTRNELGPTPTLTAPVQLVRGLRPIVAAGDNVLIGEIAERGRRIWVLSDPDVISNHGLAKGNAALAVAMLERLRAADGAVVFDETIHGHTTSPASPLALLFRFPFVIATLHGVIAIGLLLWATMGRFGAAQTAPPQLSAGRGGLLQNMAQLIEYTGHQPAMVARYVQATISEVARQLHAPRGLSPDALITWLQRVGEARAAKVDCRELAASAGEIGRGRRMDARGLARLAQDTHRWRREILDGR
ncbi:MAG: hypothetical protein IT537_26880 [Hyphomicrobiales bacterium]|nr:hypothetical protein [Hyphomicrobiales bacterium]